MIKSLNSISFFKTIYFNFKSFPFKEAIKFPIIIGKCVVLKNIGTIALKNKQHRCHIGSTLLFNSCNRMPLIWDNRGTIEINGRIIIQPGSCVHTTNGAILQFGGNNYIGKGCSILCHKQITFGQNSRLSWNCQVSDTDFHFIENMNSGNIKNNCHEIVIGDNVWIGNNVIIGKGVILASHLIVGQGSMIVKSFLEPNQIIVGNPASPINGKFKRIWDIDIENRLALYFKNSNSKVLYSSEQI